jgi:hypothetical protein
VKKRTPAFTLWILILLIVACSNCTTLSHAKPEHQGIYLFCDNKCVELPEYEDWPNYIDAVSSGKPILMIGETRPKITVYMQGWTDTSVQLVSKSSDNIEFDVTYSDSSGEVFDIQPLTELEIGQQYCIVQVDVPSDNRHWCFITNGDVTAHRLHPE